MEQSSEIESIENQVLKKRFEEMEAAQFETYTKFVNKIAILEARINLLTDSFLAIKSHINIWRKS